MTLWQTGTALTAEQVERFDTDGFVVLPGRIPGDLLRLLQRAAEHWTSMPRTGDHLVAGDVLWRVDYLHDKGEDASLALLGSPEVLGIAESLAGRDLVPTYESMVVKAEGSGAPVPWHQDAVHARRHRLFNVDVYLDAARPGEGALRVLPGSHRSRTDSCRLRDEHGWDVPGAVEVAMEPGDVLVHDDMLVHGSPPTRGSAQRRTVYLEFRPAASIQEDGPWDDAWLEARLRLLPAALAAHARLRPQVPPFRWQPSAHLRPSEEGAELRVVHGTHTPGEWCSAGSPSSA